MNWRGVLVLVALLGCRGAVAEGQAPKAKVVDVTERDYEMPALPHAKITVTDAVGGKHVIDAEVALNRDARTRGMMWRTFVEEGKGMIFLFPQEQPVSFWMKNTLISLDLVFITAGKQVAGCVERAEPQTLTSRSVARPAQYVLEVQAGWCQRLNIKPGGQVTMEGLNGLKILPDW